MSNFNTPNGAAINGSSGRSAISGVAGATASATIAAVAFIVTSAVSSVQAGAVVQATALRTKFSEVTVQGSAAVNGDDILVTKISSAAIAANATLTAAASQTHAVTSDFSATASISTLPRIIKEGVADVSATATTVINPALANKVQFTAATVDASAETASYGVREVRPLTTLDAEASIIANGGLLVAAVAEVNGEATVSAQAVRVKIATADIVGVVSLEVDSVSNPESYDPFERTFVRPPQNALFARPPTIFVYTRPTINQLFVRPPQQFTFRRP